MKALTTPRFLIILLLILAPVILSAQTKRANVWHFRYAAFDFNYGTPPLEIPRIPLYYWGGECSISDTNGNFLFCFDFDRVLDKNGSIMEGGYFNHPGPAAYLGPIAFPKPGSERFYYLFSYKYTGTVTNDFIWTLTYSMIDMHANNGLGKVCDSVYRIHLDTNFCLSLSAVHHYNGKDVWVLAHQKNTNNIYAYLVTESGVNDPVISSAGDNAHFNYDMFIKLSPDGKRFVKNTTVMVGYTAHTKTQVLSFDNKTGVVSESEMFEIPHSLRNFTYKTFEFSPDGSKFYLSDFRVLNQYDLRAGTPEQILASKYSYELDTITEMEYVEGSLQLGPDGKIYIEAGDGNDVWMSASYLSVIHSPNLAGAASDFRQNDLFMGQDAGATFESTLPNFLTDWLKDPIIIADKRCSNEAVNFSLELNGSIDSVFWDFNDWGNVPNDTSTALNPLYKFSGPGTYHITAEIHFGNLQKVIPYKIEIVQAPEPDLGSDTIICPDDPINLTLDAGPGEIYNWNNNFTPGDSIYQIIDTGTYWVRVRANGCSGYDTITVSRYEDATADTSNAIFTNSNCNLSDGSIAGIVFDAQPPFTITWTNASGAQIGTGNDLIGIPAGSYTATLTFGNSCTQSFGPYDINDNGAIQIAQVNTQDDHCSQLKGSIQVIPGSGNPADYKYSINGVDYYSNGGYFKDLPGGTYVITLRNQSGCISAVVYDTIANIPEPAINCISTPETGSNGDGTITVISPEINLTYQLEGGLLQLGNLFTGLSANTYYVIVTDEFGCSTRDTVIVGNLQGSLLVALADNDRKCLYKPANSDIRIARVTGMKDLKATLYFNDNILNCTNFNANISDFPGITAQLFSIPPRVELAWHGTTSITSTDTLSLGSMIFETLLQGAADVSWEPNSSVTYFLNESSDTIQPILIPGTIIVHELPVIALDTNMVLCAQESITLVPQITGGTDPFEYAWLTPNGTSPSPELEVLNAEPADAGSYLFSVSDNFHCADTVQVNLTVVPLPTANFPANNPTQDTIPFEKTYQLIATPGYASYEWNTGDTIYYVNVTQEGEYTVNMQTEEGCQAIESVYMLETFVPIQVPNAFTPNGDGLNDTFKPIVNTELVRQFSMSIYNKWGQRIFETSNASQGWDGENGMTGVYNWVISYSNILGKVYQMKGVVSLVK